MLSFIRTLGVLSMVDFEKLCVTITRNLVLCPEAVLFWKVLNFLPSDFVAQLPKVPIKVIYFPTQQTTEIL